METQSSSTKEKGHEVAPNTAQTSSQGTSETFKVTVAANEHIDDLAKLVHEQGIDPAEHAILAKKLVLLKVDIHLDAHDEGSLQQLVINANDEGVQKLTNWKPVSQFWPTQPAIDRLHIFVKLPAAGEQSLSFLCMASSDNDAFFSLTIPFNWSPIVYSFVATSLNLFESCMTHLVHPIYADRSWLWCTAIRSSHLFSSPPSQLLNQSGADSRKRKAAEAVDEPDDFKKAKISKMANTAPAESSRPDNYEATQKYPSEIFLDDRPSADINIPPSPLLYHGFGHFDDVYNGKHDVPRLSDINFRALEVAVDDFADKMAEFFGNEDAIRDQGLPLLNAIFSCHKESAPSFSRLCAQSIYHFLTNGHNLAAHLSAGMVVGFKNRITEISSIPEIEAAAYIAHLNVKSDYHDEIFNRWRVPYLGITVIAHQVTFYAIIPLGHQYRVVNLAPTLSCLRSASNSTDRSKLYRAFAAASVLDMHIFADVDRTHKNPPPKIHLMCWRPAVSRLRKYSTLGTMDTSGPECCYLEFQILDDQGLANPSRLHFMASTTDNILVFIKFTRRYCDELHALCAKLGRAPQLLAFERLPGGWYGVAMEYITPSEPLLLIPTNHVKRKCWQKELQEVMNQFHKKNLVHGNLRDTNIIVKDDEHVMLVDFDWGGEHGKAVYPKWDLNVELHEGRKHDDLIIRKEDDERILAYAFSK